MTFLSARPALHLFYLTCGLLLAGCAATRPVPEAIHATTQLDGTVVTLQAEQLFVRGLALAALNNHNEAVQVMQEALRLAPGEAAILSSLAESYSALDNQPSALFYAEEAHKLAPHHVDVNLQLASLYQSAGLPERAVEVYGQVLSLQPRNEKALLETGRIQAALGEYRKSAEAFERLADVAGDRTDLQNQLLSLYVLLKDEAKVEQALLALTTLEPGNDVYHRQLAEFYVGAQQLEKAVQSYEQAYALNAEDLDVRLALAGLYKQLGRAPLLASAEGPNVPGGLPAQLVVQAQALIQEPAPDREAVRTTRELVNEAVLENPSDTDLLLAQADLTRHLYEYSQAGDLYYRIVQSNPRNIDLWAQTALTFLQAQQPTRALAVAGEGLLLFPGQIPLILASTKALSALGKMEEARSNLQGAFSYLSEGEGRRVDEEAMLISALGDLHRLAGTYIEAERLYAQALDLYPDLTDALHGYTLSVLARKGPLEHAATFARRVAEAEPGNAIYLATLGQVLFEQSHLDEARRWFERALQSGPPTSSIYEHLGDLSFQQGDASKAKAFWLQALELDPENTTLKEKIK